VGGATNMLRKAKRAKENRCGDGATDMMELCGVEHNQDFMEYKTQLLVCSGSVTKRS
jgi:hypothetical protein